MRFALLSLLISVGLGATLYFYFRTQIRQQLRQHLQDVVSLTAAQISGDEHALIQPGDDRDSTSYSRVLASIQSIHMTGSKIADIYTMRLDDKGEVMFVIDTDEEDPAAVGEVYPDPGPVLAANLSTMDEAMVESDFYTDKWGTWLSGYAPIYRSNGQREAILAIDISAEEVIAHEHRLLWIILLISTVSTATASGLGWWWAHHLTRPLLQMVAMAALIAEGDLATLAQGMAGVAQGDLNQTFMISTSPLEVTGTDEVGRLGRSFNQMHVRLQEIESAFDKMSSDLRTLVGEIASQAQATSSSSSASGSDRQPCRAGHQPNLHHHSTGRHRHCTSVPVR